MTSIRYDVSLFVRLVRSLPVLLAYCALVIVVLMGLPRDAQMLSLTSIVILGLIGIWRYLWLIAHVIRAALYEHWMYPKIQFAAEQIPPEKRYPKRLFFVIPTYNEKPEVSERMLRSVLDEASDVPSEIIIFVNAGSDEEDELFRQTFYDHPGSGRMRLEFVRQIGGKRQGMADTLTELSTREIDPNDAVVLMDGDTILGKGILEKCLPLFVLRPRLGAVTTDNLSVTTGNAFYRKWYTLRFAMRHRMMKSQSLSGQLLVLTGRFSMFRAKDVVEEEFIANLENDRINHWLHGEIKFVTGDDKSTWYTLLNKGAEMLYVPDAHIYCMEDSTDRAFAQSIKKMHRWFGNMLRNNGRAILLGPGRQKPFIWWCLVDQRISMWTSLLGPAAALWAAFWLSPYYIVIYLMLVVLVRSIYLILLVVEGHRMSVTDIPMLLYTQWVGSLVKIYTLFHLHQQKWDSHRTKDASGAEEREAVELTELIPKLQIVLSMCLFLLFVSAIIGIKE